MISVLQSVCAYRIFEGQHQSGAPARALCAECFGQSLAMFESISDLMRSVEKSKNLTNQLLSSIRQMLLINTTFWIIKYLQQLCVVNLS